LKNEVDVLLIKIFESKLKTQKADYFDRLKNIENKYSLVRNEKQRDELIKQDKKKLNKEFGFDLEEAEKQLKEFTSGRKIKPFFLWNLYFSEVFHSKGGFDVVIANPPYISVEKFARTAQQAEFKRRFKTYASRGDIYCFFYERGLCLLCEAGVLTFISSNKFQRAGYGKGLRQLLATQRIETLMDFCELPVFVAAADPMIVIIAKAVPPPDHEFPVVVIKDEFEINSLPQSLADRGTLYKTKQLKADSWSLEGSEGLTLVEKLQANRQPLGEYIGGTIMAGIT